MKEQKHYLYFLKETKALYAYTNEKTIAKAFELFRDESLFFKKEKRLSSFHMKELYKENSGCILHIEDFRGIKLAITKEELITVENTITKVFCVDLQLAAVIPIEVFREDVQISLKLIHYNDIYDSSYKFGSSSPFEIFEADRLGCFLHLYGNTMKH